ncbi:SMI1/KNR4 family protein [Streptomyces tirandamycinicus]|uniref:SMI1/KNR4 family protein n=1 Tax=Streptomyces tirandamycinicus TaxID=2174846 RepID=UPI00226EE4BE|nr:SMI1/KNR4 family protein [Streptomyces tirandamycinicus]MCY0980194.1 SMI1/KNR4 family protein [Streptomyces tirandamycinicus]
MDYLRAVFAMLGESTAPSEGSARQWRALEARLGTVRPDDYEAVVDAYAPVQMNGHLYLVSPDEGLAEYIERVVEEFRDTSWRDDVACPGFERTGPRFGGAAGMIPLADTDRGDYVFSVREPDTGAWRILTCDGDEQDFHEYRMSFAEWLHGYLEGGDMIGPGSSVFYPGPVRMERWSRVRGERPLVWHGPDRGR